MQLALEKCNDEKWRREYAAESTEGPAAKKQKTGPSLTTKVVLWDDGKQKTELQTVKAPRKENQVDDTPWTEWMESSLGETYRDEKIAKHVFAQCCLWHLSHIHVSKAPIVIQLVNGKARVIAAEDILPGCLRIPVFCRNDSNYFTPSHPVQGNFHEVIGEVVWIDEKTGNQDKKIKISCQPE